MFLASSRPYSFSVRLNEAPGPCHVPVSTHVDFAAALRQTGARGEWDPASVVVVRMEADGTETVIPYALAEELRYGDAGDVSWVASPDDMCEYRVYFDTVSTEYGRRHTRVGGSAWGTARALIGNGDALRYNSGFVEPLDVGIPVQMPVLVDWDGDSRTDLIVGSAYANTLGQPYHGSWFFRNIGSESKPLFDDFLRLQVDGEPIGSQVFEALDWDGDGLVDLIGKPYNRNELHVYRNTGRQDRNGLPVLTAGERIDLTALLGPGGQCGAGFMQLADLHGDGRVHLVASVRRLQDTSRYGHIFGPYYDNELLVFPNQAPAGVAPALGAPEPLCLADGSPLTLKGSAGGAVGDWDGDGVWDVILAECQGSKQFLRLFCNRGTALEPQLVDAGLLAAGQYTALSGRYFGNPPFRGFLILEKSWFFRWLEDVGLKPGLPVLRDRGYLPQRAGRVSVGSYSWPVICDWDGDGGRDIVAGSASGCPYLIEEVGRRDPPVYRPRRVIEAAGQPIRHTWGEDLAHTGGERTEGYWQPAVVDWDGDGLSDLLAPVGVEHGRLEHGQPVPAGRLYFYRNCGTRSEPRFESRQEILLADGSAPVATHVAFPVDWDGDGRPELVAFDPAGRLCVFASTVDPLVLQPGVPLRMADGRLFVDQIVFEQIGRRWGLQHAVCDWDGRGLFDIIVGTRETLLLYRNQGSRRAPAFAPGEMLRLWGKTIQHSVHSLRPCPVDWDGTGCIDMLAGSESGWFHLFRRAALDGPRPAVETGAVRVEPGHEAHR